MTNEQLFKALGEVDEAMLDENVETITISRTPKHRFALWAGTAAACVCLCAVGANVLPDLLPRTEGGSSTADELLTASDSGITYQLLPVGSDANNTCTSDEGTLTFFMNEYGSYSITDSLSSAYPETGTYVRDGNVITCTSENGETTVFEIPEINGASSDMVLKLKLSEKYDDLEGRLLTARINPEQLLSNHAEITSVELCGQESHVEKAQSESGEVQDITYTKQWYYELEEAEITVLHEHLTGLIVYQNGYPLPTMKEYTARNDDYELLTITLADGTTHMVQLYDIVILDAVSLLPEHEPFHALCTYLDTLYEKATVNTYTAQDDTICNNYWVPLENGIRYETVFCGTELEDPQNFQAIEFILDPWHMEYQIIDPMTSGNAEIERGTYSIDNGIYTLTSPDGKTSQLEAVEDTSEWKWELKVLSCDSFPDYVGMVFTSKMQEQKPFAEMEDLVAVTAEDVMMTQAQKDELAALLKELTVYQTLTVPEEDAEGHTVANIHLTFDSESYDIRFYDEWMIYSDGTAWLADKEQIAQIVKLHQDVLASYVEEGWYPFAELDASKITGIDVFRLTAGDPGSYYLEKEVPDLVALLQNITAYEEDPEFGEQCGSTPYVLTLTGAGGVTTEIGIYSDHIYYDNYVFYAAGSKDCAAVRDWIDGILNKALEQGWGTEEPPFGEEGAMQPFAELADGAIVSGYILNEQDGSEITIPSENLSGLEASLRGMTVYTEDQQNAAVRNTDANWYRMVFTLEDGSELSYRCTVEDKNMLWIDGAFYWVYSEDYTELYTQTVGFLVFTGGNEVHTFIGNITAIDGNIITVGAVVNGGSIEPGESEPVCLYSFSAAGLLMHDNAGTALSISDFAVGDTVYVSYTGEIQESYPNFIVNPTKLQLYAE